jgi:type IV pilus assembly protein PilO
VDLIAGQDRIQTFLALLNQVARRTQVSITRYEPLASSPPPTPEASRRQSRTTKKQQKPVDPLQSLGYRKTAVALNVTGPYTGLQRFLQQMEALEVMVESSELNLQASNSRDADSPQASAALKTDLKLKLSFYDRISPSKESNATTRAKSAPV